MANHSSTKKAIRKTITQTAVNKNRKTSIKTYVKKVIKLVTENDLAKANEALVLAQSRIMKGVTAGVLKKNTASRMLSLLVKKVKLMSSSNNPDLNQEKAAKTSTASAKNTDTKIAEKKDSAIQKDPIVKENSTVK